MHKVTIFLKSGNRMEFDCEELTTVRNGFGAIVRLKWNSGKSKKRLTEVDIDQIEGIVVEDIE